MDKVHARCGFVALTICGPAFAWGSWMGDAKKPCPAPEKPSFMHTIKKDSPYCSPRGGCGPGRHREKLIDSSGFDFDVCADAGRTPPPIAVKLTCDAPERLAYRNPL